MLLASDLCGFTAVKIHLFCPSSYSNILLIFCVVFLGQYLLSFYALHVQARGSLFITKGWKFDAL